MAVSEGGKDLSVLCSKNNYFSKRLVSIHKGYIYLSREIYVWVFQALVFIWNF